MSRTIKTVVAMSLIALAAACAQQEEEPVYIEEPVMAEPTSNKM